MDGPRPGFYAGLMTGNSDSAPMAKVIPPDAGEVMTPPPGMPLPRITRLLGANDGAGLSLIVYEAPGGFAPPPVLHRHTRESCVGYVVEGALRYWFDDGAEHLAPAGSAVCLPSGAWFRWGNASPTETAKVLFMFTPAGFDEFFFDLGAALNTPGFDMASFGSVLHDLRARYGDEERTATP